MFDDDLLDAAADATDVEEQDAPSTGPVANEPAWMALFRSRAPAEEVAAKWLEDMEPEERQAAEKDPLVARAKLRECIVEARCADANDGWKYTGAVLRAGDAVLGIKIPKAAPAFRAKMRDDCIDLPGTVPFRVKRIIEGDGSPGTLGMWWSDFESAKQAEKLVEHCGVTRRLSCAAELVGKFPSAELGQVVLDTEHVPMEDSLSDEEDVIETWIGQMRRALDLLREWRREGAIVNINCKMGKNRSGAVVLTWLCTECGWELDKGVEHLREMNPLACANPHLAEAMRRMLQAEDIVPLNPAPDGGGWICLSPPGTPRDGALAPSFEDLAAHAAAKLQDSQQ